MKKYSQRNIRWGWQRLGTCKVRIRQAGCFITALCNLADTKIKNPRGRVVECHPGILDWRATVDGLYANGCLVVSKSFAKLLDLEYNGKSKTPPDYNCIAETDHYRRYGVPQHFFVYLTNGKIIDSLDGKEKDNPYKIVSYRLFKNRKEDDKCKILRAKVEKYEQKLKNAKKELEQCR